MLYGTLVVACVVADGFPRGRPMSATRKICTFRLSQATSPSTADSAMRPTSIELILDSNRNSLLGLDLRVSIATLGLTAGALVAGLFGMVRRTSRFK